MSEALRIVLVRHGETEWNNLRRIQGQLDTPLNQAGVAQARAVARRLADWPIAALYTSDLARASRTAEPVAVACGVAAQPDPRLRERHFGQLQGRFYEELQRTDPQRHRRMQSRDLTFDMDGGETIPVFYERVCTVLRELAMRHRDGTIVVVTHGGVLDCGYRLASGLALDATRTYGLYNASLNTICFERGAFRVVSWGDVAHLAAPADEIDARLLN